MKQYTHLILILNLFFYTVFFAQEKNEKDLEKQIQPSKTEPMDLVKQLESDMTAFKIQEWTPPNKELRRISLQECVQLAIMHNLDLRVESHNPKIAEQEIIVSRSRFDTVFFAGVTARESIRETGSVLEGSISHTIDYEVGLRKDMLTGGNVELSFNTGRRSTNNSFASLDPSWSSSLTLSLTQPLLKGLGWDLNQITIRTNENRLELAYLTFEARVIQIVQQVTKSYWDLVFSIADLKVKQLSLELAKRLVEINNAKFEAGVIAKIEIIQAETDVAVRKEAVLFAQSAIEDNEEVLKKLINPSEDNFLYKTTLRPTEIPRFQKKAVDIQDATKKALAHRPELKQLDIELNNLRLSEQQAQNNLLPSLNFVGSIGLSGLQPILANSVDSTFSGDQYEWATGFVFEVPLGNREARARYRQVLLQKKQTQDQYLAQVATIKFEISRLLRAINTFEASIYASRESTRLAKEQLLAEEQRFNVGLSTNFRVSEVQEDYVQALSRELKAIIDYEKSLIDLDTAQTSILESVGVNIQKAE